VSTIEIDLKTAIKQPEVSKAAGKFRKGN